MISESRELRELSERLTEIADDLEAEMYERDITSGAGYWTIQAIVRLRMGARWADWAAVPGTPGQDVPSLTMRDTERMMKLLDPDDARRLDERLSYLVREDVATYAGEHLLEELFGAD